jgi:hypothetical protein
MHPFVQHKPPYWAYWAPQKACPVCAQYGPRRWNNRCDQLKLPGAQDRAEVAGVPHGQISPADRHFHLPQGGQDLLVNAVSPPCVVAQREQPGVIDHGHAAGPVRARVARAAHHVRGLVTGPQWREQLTQVLPFSRLDHGSWEFLSRTPDLPDVTFACQDRRFRLIYILIR